MIILQIAAFVGFLLFLNKVITLAGGNKLDPRYHDLTPPKEYKIDYRADPFPDCRPIEVEKPKIADGSFWLN